MRAIISLLTVYLLSNTLYALDCEKPVSDDRFNSLFNTINIDKMTDQKKYILISSYSQRECFTVNQMILFIDLIDNHKIQISTVQAIYQNLFDVDNADLLLNRFSDYEKKVILKTSR